MADLLRVELRNAASERRFRARSHASACAVTMAHRAHRPSSQRAFGVSPQAETLTQTLRRFPGRSPLPPVPCSVPPLVCSRYLDLRPENPELSSGYVLG